jgi:hypothetical protein
MTKRAVILICLVLWMFSSTWGIERKARHLTPEKVEKNRAFYNIPVSFPKSEADIRADLVAQLKQSLSGGGRTSPMRAIWSKVVNGELDISRIIRVVNYSASDEFEYDYLIEASMAPGKVCMVFIMTDLGKLRYISHESPEGKIPPVEADDRILSALKDRGGINIRKGDIEKIEWISERTMSGITRGLFTPARRLVLKDGTVYYMHRGTLYKVISRQPSGPGKTFTLIARKNFEYIFVDHTLSGYVEELGKLQ